MGIKNIVTSFAGEVGFNPNLARIECTDSLSTITSQNYLSDVIYQGYNFKNGDFVLINSSAEGSSGIFQFVVTNNVRSLEVVSLTTVRLASNKQSCLCATTEALTGEYYNGPNDDGVGATFTFTATGLQIIDGIPLQMESITGPFRILVKDGSTHVRGMYELNRDGSTGIQCQLTRAPDFNNTSNVNQGDFTLIVGGNENGGTIWYEFLSGPFLIGHSALQFSQVHSVASTNSSYIPQVDGIILESNTAINVTSIVLPAGKWMVFGSVGYSNDGGSISRINAGISTTSATFPDSGMITTTAIITAITTAYSSPVPMQIITSDATTTVYLVASAVFPGDPPIVFGGINIVEV